MSFVCRHNQTYKAHKNGIKRPKKNAYASRKGVSARAPYVVGSTVASTCDRNTTQDHANVLIGYVAFCRWTPSSCEIRCLPPRPASVPTEMFSPG